MLKSVLVPLKIAKKSISHKIILIDYTSIEANRDLDFDYHVILIQME